jgi:hypothetical protein
VALARFHDHIAAFASVSAGRAAPRNKFFAPEREAAVAAVARLHTNYRLIYEHVWAGSDSTPGWAAAVKDPAEPVHIQYIEETAERSHGNAQIGSRSKEEAANEKQCGPGGGQYLIEQFARHS